MPCGVVAEGIGVMVAKGGRPIIRDIDLEISAGSFVAVIGESGAGKSTLLRSLSIQLGKEGDFGDLYLEYGDSLEESGEEVPATRFLVDGNSHDEFLQRLGFVPQEELFVDVLSVEEVLRDACCFAGIAESVINTRVQELLASVGLPEPIRGNAVSTLSGGQKRRLSIARALASEPEMLFLDEPTSGLDLPVAQGVMDMLVEICRSKSVTVVCTSHLPSTLQKCDRVLVMAVGKNRAGGYIAADYDARSFRAALAADKTGTAIYAGGDRRHDEAPHAARQRKAPSALVAMPFEAVENPGGAHFRAVFLRSIRAWWRDLTNLWVFAAQPILLAFMVVVTQSMHGAYAGDFIDFFLTISALWIGMSACVRDFVSERKLYALDELSGLSEWAYLWAKICVALLLTLVGVFVLCLSAHLMVAAADRSIDLAHAAGQFSLWHFVPRLLILAVTGISGALIGLSISLLVKTERTAISLMPLALMPQVVFSRFACGFGRLADGEGALPYSSMKFWYEQRPGFENLIDCGNFVASLPMSSRHACWSLSSLTHRGFEWSQFFWNDFGWLVGITCAQAGLVILVFKLTAKDSLSRIR